MGSLWRRSLQRRSSPSSDGDADGIVDSISASRDFKENFLPQYWCCVYLSRENEWCIPTLVGIIHSLSFSTHIENPDLM
jgi:hypothetical protein